MIPVLTNPFSDILGAAAHQLLEQQRNCWNNKGKHQLLIQFILFLYYYLLHYKVIYTWNPLNRILRFYTHERIYFF